MPIESDVLVIGGGLAGLTSALSAARSGADVRLVSYKQSTLGSASGLIDLLGYRPDGTGPIVEPIEAIGALPAGHPYRTVGRENVQAGMALFDDVATGYQGSHTDANALLPTHGGTVKPTARYPAATSEGLASDERAMLLVGFESLVDFDAPHAAAHLRAAGVPFDVRGTTLRFPGSLRPDAAVTRYAKLLDQNATVTAPDGERPVRDVIAERVDAELETAERVGFPAILGDEAASEVRAALAERLGVPVFEIPMGPPSLPGLRLEDTLFEALDGVGASIETGNPVVAYDGDDSVETVYVDKNGARIPNRADQYILATGGLVGKGIESDRGSVYEPIFDCHVPHDADRYEWSSGEVYGDHEFATFGVRTDAELRPVTASGEPEFDNLRAAGAVLGGYDAPAEKSAAGVSIATGYTAGRAAATEGR
ncbi:MAG: glycerol-3-phosphate dehydrogenase subunit GlpB [Halobacteriaceae archaeon]